MSFPWRHYIRHAARRGCTGLDDKEAAVPSIYETDHLATLGKTAPHLCVLQQALAPSAQTFGYFFSGMACQVLGASVNLDAGNDCSIGEDFDKRTPSFYCGRIISS